MSIRYTPPLSPNPQATHTILAQSHGEKTQQQPQRRVDSGIINIEVEAMKGGGAAEAETKTGDETETEPPVLDRYATVLGGGKDEAVLKKRKSEEEALTSWLAVSNLMDIL